MTIEIGEAAGVRSLHFGSEWVQGAMRIARPYALELEYTREMMAALLLRPQHRWPRRVLLIGLGAGSLVKFLYRHRPHARLTVVEIDPAVVHAARQFFKLPDDPARIRIEIGDGAEYLARGGSRFDLILVDGFDAHGKSGQLDTPAFYLNCKASLSDAGLLSTNLLSRRRDYRRSLARIDEAFDGRSLALPPCGSGNAIVLATAGEITELTQAELKTAALALKKESGLNLLPTLARLEQAGALSGGALTL